MESFIKIVKGIVGKHKKGKKSSEKILFVIIKFQTGSTVQKQPPEVFCKKKVLRNFAKFTGKPLCQSLIFNKVAGVRPATLLKKRL